MSLSDEQIARLRAMAGNRKGKTVSPKALAAVKANAHAQHIQAIQAIHEKLGSLTSNANGCKIWGQQDRPQISKAIGGGTSILARYVLEHKLGRKISPGLFACHTCDNEMCVEAGHLYEGTHRDNTNDAMARGRLATGDRNGSRLHPDSRPRGKSHPRYGKKGQWNK